MEFLELVFRLVAGLVGFPALLAALINLAKYFGLPDGTAGQANLIAHLVVYVCVGVLVLLGRVDILPGLDVQLGAIANLLIAILAFLSSMSIARGFHNRVLRGLPIVGKTHTDEEDY